ncbi:MULTISPECIES: hypothetical protein [unclassified Streptomyces]|uniref:hypothetical protein n=1 Tax=unclassified Streptomyces TaxID=2593676 RepID=UPI002E159FD8|nr:hypothetical protein OG452_24825 [Streptomyces sp. NBC_01197]WSS49023.1 hypothetical protein OG708_10420 [Streptomyces sp. NBC_01180]
MNAEVARLAARVAELERRLAAASRTSRLAYSSIENGAIDVYDEDGGLRGAIGQQPDGTTGAVAVNGPPPPTPSAPLAEPALAGLRVTWDGGFIDALAPPLDLTRVQVHLLTSVDAVPDVRWPAATIEAASGASVTIALSSYTGLFVRLVAVNTSGIPGPASAAVAAQARQATGPDLAAGSVDLTRTTGALADSARRTYTDSLDDPTAWAVTTKGPGAEWTYESGLGDAETGNSVGQAVGHIRLQGTSPIPYDPTALYRISARVRATVPGEGGLDTLYFGVMGLAADGVTMVNATGADATASQYYVGASRVALPTSSGWTTFAGYLKGRADPTGKGSSAEAHDPRQPALAHDKVRYITPYFLLNYESRSATSAATMQVDALQIEAIHTGAVGPENLVAGSVTATALSADAITGKVVTGGTVRTGTSGPRLIMAPEAAGSGVPGVAMYSGHPQESGPGMFSSNTVSAGGTVVPEVRIAAPTTDDGPALMWLRSPALGSGAGFRLDTNFRRSFCFIDAMGGTDNSTSEIKLFAQNGTVGPASILLLRGDQAALSSGLVKLNITPDGMSATGRVQFNGGITVEKDGLVHMRGGGILVDGSPSWTKLSLKSGFTHGDGDARWREITIAGQRFLQMAGTVNVTASGGLTADAVFAALTSFTPSYSVPAPVGRNNAAGVAATRISWGVDGSFTVYNTTGSNVKWFSLESVLLSLE